MSEWFSTCPACGLKLGPWTLGADALCQGHEKPVAIVIDYPGQQRHFTPTNAQTRGEGGTDVRTCDVEGCGRKHKGHGLCALHLERRRLGSPPLLTYQSGEAQATTPADIQRVSDLADAACPRFILIVHPNFKLPEGFHLGVAARDKHGRHARRPA